MNTRIQSRSIALLAVLWTASAAMAAPSTVTVSESTTGGITTYSYRVHNGSSQPVVGLRIGFDSASGEAQLGATPLGWTVEDGLPAASATSPAGWSSRLVTTEESELVDLEWSSDADSQFDIAPGATAIGFSIRLAEPAVEYRTAAFVLTLADSTFVSGTVELEADAVPPLLSVTMSPAVLWPPNHRMANVTASITVSDDLDPTPSVRLVSITANEPLAPGDVEGATLSSDDRQFALRSEREGQSAQGRVYTITYSATDASGNQATAQATVTVPHDQGN